MSTNAELPERSPPKQRRSGGIWRPTNIGDFSSLLAGVGIGLFALGFVIWQIHLASFGAAGPSLFQARLVSAGLCYLVFCTAFVLPSATLVQGILNDVGSATGDSDVKRRTSGILLTLWYLLILQIVSLLLPTAKPSVGFMLFAGVPVLLSLVAKFWKMEKWKSVRVAIDSPHFAYGGASSIYMVGVCLTEPRFTLFVLYSLVVWVLVAGEGRAYRDDTWSHSNWSVRLMSYALAVLLALSHTIAFSKSVFPLVPRQFGGGASERALLVVEDVLAPTLLRLGFRAANEFIGPVEIVARDSDYLWISLPENHTNAYKGVSIQVPLSSVRLTEFISNPAVHSRQSPAVQPKESLPNTSTNHKPAETGFTNHLASP